MALPMAVVGFQSCENDYDYRRNEELNPSEQVIVVLKPDIKARDAFNFINEFSLPVSKMTHNNYVVSLPPANQQILIDVLMDKNYIHRNDSSTIRIRPDAVGNQMFLSLVLYDMDLRSNQSDWLSTMTELSIKESDTASGGYELTFEIPKWTADYYVMAFKTYEAVQSAYPSQDWAYPDDLP
jgi:hypothetical protein